MNDTSLTDPELEALVAEAADLTAEIDQLGDLSGELRQRRMKVCARARAKGATTVRLGDVCHVTPVAVTQWVNAVA